jgi:hypothetical protein
MLDVGVSSTERIAAFWGLLPAAAPILKPRLRQAANTRSIPIASKPHIRASATTQARRVPMDLQTIIEGALKTAGVLKRR